MTMDNEGLATAGKCYESSQKAANELGKEGAGRRANATVQRWYLC